LDNVDVNKVLDFEALIYEKMDTTYKSLSDEILDKKDMTPEIEVQVKQLLEEVKSEIN